MIWRIWKRGHRRYRELLSEYIDDRLGADDRSRFEEHLGTCSECAQELESLKATVALLRSVSQAEVPRSFQLQEVPVQREERPLLLRSLQLSTAVAAMLLVALLAGDALGAFDDGITPLETQVQEEQLEEEATAAALPEEAPVPESEVAAMAEAVSEAPVEESLESFQAEAMEAEAPSGLVAEMEEPREEEAAQPEERVVAEPAIVEEEGDGASVVRKIEIAAGALAGLLAVATALLMFQRRRTPG